MDLSEATVKEFLAEKKLTSDWESFKERNSKQVGAINDDDKDLRNLVKKFVAGEQKDTNLNTLGKPDAIKYFLEAAREVDMDDASWQSRAIRVFPAAITSGEPRRVEALESNDNGGGDNKQTSALTVPEVAPVASSANTDVYIKSNIEDGCYHDINVVVNGTTYHVQCPLRLKKGSCIAHSESKGRSDMWTDAIEMNAFKRSKSEQVEKVVKKIREDLSKVTDDDLSALTNTMARLTLAVSSEHQE
jgi:hypothetical protein